MYLQIPHYEKHDVCLMCLCVSSTCQCFNLCWSTRNLAHGRTCRVAKVTTKRVLLISGIMINPERKKNLADSAPYYPWDCVKTVRWKGEKANSERRRFCALLLLSPSQRNLRRFNSLKQSSRPHDGHTASAHVDTLKCNNRWLEMDCYWTRAILEKPESSRQGFTTEVQVTL